MEGGSFCTTEDFSCFREVPRVCLFLRGVISATTVSDAIAVRLASFCTIDAFKRAACDSRERALGSSHERDGCSSGDLATQHRAVLRYRKEPTDYGPSAGTTDSVGDGTVVPLRYLKEPM